MWWVVAGEGHSWRGACPLLSRQRAAGDNVATQEPPSPPSRSLRRNPVLQMTWFHEVKDSKVREAYRTLFESHVLPGSWLQIGA